MAKYANGTNYAKAIDPTGANQVDPGVLGGKIRVMEDTAVITAGTTMKSTDYIIVGNKLPTGAQVVSIVVASSTVALSTNNAIVVGDEGDADRYVTSIQLTTNAVATGITNIAGVNYQITGTTDNYIRVAGAVAGSQISSGTVSVAIFYTVE
jgi:hypothetical protein